MTAKVTGYDYFFDKNAQKHYTVTHWSDGNKTVAEDVTVSSKTGGLLRMTIPVSNVPVSARFLNSWRKEV
jgi:hypothetical protein